jgi:hypothetical protein
MNATTVKILSTNIKGQLDGADIGGGICIAGSPGIGKTQTMYKIANDLDMNIVQVSIPEISTENLSGIPDFMDAVHMDEYSTTNTTQSQATKWSVPQIIETVNRLAKERNGCILFIDDLHRVNMAVAPYLYGLLGERKLGSYKLDSKVAIMGAMNDSDEAGFSGVDSPIKDRIGILPVPFDFDYWYNNFGKHLHFYIASFLKAHSTYVQEDESTMIEQFATPRSWTHLANEFELYDRDFIQDNTIVLAKQKVSKAAANELAKHIAYVEAIDFTSKVKNKEMVDINSLKPIDQILYAYIINYVDSIDDASYVMELIDNNSNCSNFIGFIAGELMNKFLAKENGKKISDGLVAILEKFMDIDMVKEDYSKLTKKDIEIYDKMAFNDVESLQVLAAEFVH